MSKKKLCEEYTMILNERSTGPPTPMKPMGVVYRNWQIHPCLPLNIFIEPVLVSTLCLQTNLRGCTAVHPHHIDSRPS